ncbi:Lrp/AsnC family transcriptional regulator [Wenxinia marina]|uniref:Transcriptional regulator, AsnC family n=1 Tax=Wenxinia marina DSM 24838 TaxID=1123501 RepID=A0A0D0Q933_9RHOB|nr:Lrp/AsnC family transcriptional regulator [Wenxinia marina]KIQ67593.1 transcriptional regulator, AsnC family [Wenxinia marina DSM 24838]GGL68232.1 AsnC family transcriptional regulator [Wenxinia marina]
MKLTDPERALLKELQSDASQPVAELGRRAGMAASTAWRKLNEFQEAGLIRARVALLDPKKAGAGLCVFAQVTLEDHSEEALAGLARIVETHPEIMEAHAMAGTADYMLKIRCADVEAYERFMTHALLRAPHVRSVVSAFSLRQMKYTTALPL